MNSIFYQEGSQRDSKALEWKDENSCTLSSTVFPTILKGGGLSSIYSGGEA